MAQDSLDANLIIHFIIGDIPKQREHVWDLLSTTNYRHHISTIAISETVYVFTAFYHLDRENIVAQLHNFFKQFQDVLDYNHPLLDLALPYYLDHPSLSFNDCLLAFDAELTHSEPLFTFDHKLSRQHPSAKLLA